MGNQFTPLERAVPLTVAALGFLGLNGAFGFAVLFQPHTVAEAMANPLAVVFVLEALVLTGVLAYLLHRWQVTRLHWVWFVVLALAGSLAFAVPIAALWNRRRGER